MVTSDGDEINGDEPSQNHAVTGCRDEVKSDGVRR
jgi:hypothetical protein